MSETKRAYIKMMRVLAFTWIAGCAALVIVSQPDTAEVNRSVIDSADQQVADLIAEHDCKVEGYGDDVIPGHAVVDTGTGPRYAKSDIAFKIAFEGHTGTVHAFCI